MESSKSIKCKRILIFFSLLGFLMILELVGAIKRSIQVPTCNTGDYPKPSYYTNGTFESYTCTICPKGNYCTGGIKTQCPSPGHNNKTGSISNTDCVACTGGQFANIQGSECYTCESYKYIVNENSTDCSGVCGAGKYISTYHDACNLCSPGSISQGDTFNCTDCPAGQTSDSTRTQCVNCQTGTYSTGGTKCKYCPSGFISTTIAATSLSVCIRCPDGQGHNPTHTACIDCTPGHYSNSLTSGCTACPSGKFQPSSATTSCLNCVAGYYSNPGASVCTICPINTYSGTVAGSCTGCAIGTFSSLGSTVCFPACGDSITAAVEPCDDSNTIDGDGCSSTCTVESGYVCKSAVMYGPTICTPICGDGKRIKDEICDDGNINNKDGCSDTCTIESGYECHGGSPISKDTCQEICGDGIVFDNSGINCDDGNRIGGDGCSSLCKLEHGWVCSGGTSSSPDICGTVCGDGILASKHEQCDDGNRVSGDGCNKLCMIESGAACINDLTAPINSKCTEICGDSKKIGIHDCDDGNTQSGDGCDSTCHFETGFVCSGGTPTKADVCIEICGDGKNMGKNECDDADTNNGNGCSSSCEYETCYECKGGSSVTRDTCNLLKISAILESVSSTNQITINFNHTMNQTSISLKDLSISIDASYPVSFDWIASYTNQTTLTIDLALHTALLGGELITVQFTNYKVWRGPNGGCLVTQNITAKAISSFINSEEVANSMSVFFQYSSYLGIVVTLLLIIIGGGSMEMLWALLNTMQLISYLPIMTPFFPNHVRIMFKILKFANLNFEFLSNAFQYNIPADLTPNSKISDVFKNNGIDSSLFLINCSSFLLAIIMYAILFCLVVIIRYISCYEKLSDFMSKVIQSFIFNNCLRFLIEGYLQIFFCSVLNIILYSVIDSVDILSFLISVIFGIICFLYPFMSAALIYDNRKEIMKGNELYLKRFGAMYSKLKQDHEWYHLQFYPIFLLRRFIFVLILTLLEIVPEVQCNLFVLSSLLVLIYLLVAKPFHHTIDNIMMIVNEISLCCIASIQIIFVSSSKSISLINNTGWVMIALCIANVLVNFCISIVYNVKMKAKKCMNKVKVNNENKGNFEVSGIHVRSNSTTNDLHPSNIRIQTVSNINNFDMFANEIRRASRGRLDSEDKF